MTEVKVLITIGDTEHSISIAEARRLYENLIAVFGPDVPPSTPQPVPRPLPEKAPHERPWPILPQPPSYWMGRPISSGRPNGLL